MNRQAEAERAVALGVWLPQRGDWVMERYEVRWAKRHDRGPFKVLEVIQTDSGISYLLVWDPSCLYMRGHPEISTRTVLAERYELATVEDLRRAGLSEEATK
jgi:hypothetical protein